ncbi:MAG: histidinol-phosphatase [Rectinemataceae bacterium]
MRANYHTHCDFCDGRATAAEMAAAAAAKGYRILGFSSHSPLPFPNEGNMELSRLGEYAAEIRRLGREWEGRGLEILLGLEIEWVKSLSSPRDELFRGIGLDYSIGSLHFVDLPGSGRFAVDLGREDFERGAAAYAGDDVGRAIYLDYYGQLGELIECGGFDILGHFDLVKKNNGDGRWFDEDSRDYLDAALGAARLLKGGDIVVEINVGGISRGKAKSPYPSLPILRELRGEGVRITLSADAHAPEHLGANLDIARDYARAAGYDSVAVLSKGKWSEVGLENT